MNYTQYSIASRSSSEESEEEEDDEIAKPLPDYVVKVLVYQALRTLNYLHKNNIVHRDIKPDNIMINHNNEAVLIDFGVSALLEDKKDDPSK